MMLRKLLAFALLTYTPGPAIPRTLVSQEILEAIPLVACGNAAGSAFRIGSGLLLSVNHVTSLKGCMIDGQPERVSYASRKSDFSMLSDDREGHWIKVDCRGFVPGHQYIAVGHARGLDQLVGVSLVATGAYDQGQAVLLGVFTAQPGQSGGPIIDAETHEVVGTVNAADWENGATFSVELKGTPICKGNLA